ncbi:hypothetical protein AVEN_23519-1, partial [Araneus ventricosus]
MLQQLVRKELLSIPDLSATPSSERTPFPSQSFSNLDLRRYKSSTKVTHVTASKVCATCCEFEKVSDRLSCWSSCRSPPSSDLVVFSSAAAGPPAVLPPSSRPCSILVC